MRFISLHVIRRFVDRVALFDRRVVALSISIVYARVADGTTRAPFRYW